MLKITKTITYNLNIRNIVTTHQKNKQQTKTKPTPHKSQPQEPIVSVQVVIFKRARAKYYCGQWKPQKRRKILTTLESKNKKIKNKDKS